MVDIKNAKNSCDELYNYLNEVSQSIISKKSKYMDDIILKISKKIDVMDNDELRISMGKLSVEAYNLSIYREDSALKENCANVLYKEKLARTFNESTGTVDSKKNQSIVASLDSQAVSILYSSVSSLLKAKVDGANRLCNTLNGILISRAADAKLSTSPRNIIDGENNENETWRVF